MINVNLSAKLQRIVQKTVDGKNSFGAVVRIESGDNGVIWSGAAGNLKEEDRYFIASTTKLYITAVLLKLRADGRLQLEDKISRCIPEDVIAGMHVYKGTDYSREITIGQLMAQTSGLPDYFQQKRESGRSLQDELVRGHDQRWTFEQVMSAVKKMKPKFRPGEKGRAFYSDTNYQLLGRIIEIITGKTIHNVLQEYIFDRLHLQNTYLYEGGSDDALVPFYYKTQPLHIPLAMTSFGPDGGIVSTARETMIFLKAFFNGTLFPKAYGEELKLWNRIFFPLEYGIGLVRFKLPRIFSPFKPTPELIGHSGLSGAFAFYCPEKDLYITGTVNQVTRPSLCFQLMMKLLNCFD